MPVVVKSVWGKREYPDTLLSIPDRHYWELIDEGYCKEIAQLKKVRDAYLDKMKIEGDLDRFLEKLRKIGLLED